MRTVGSADQEGADEQRQELGLYLFELVARHRKEPSDNLLSRLANETSADRMEDMDLVATGVLMLVAGHETTVNLISNGTLLMLRRPDLRERLRSEPEISLRFVEELLRFEPPVQYTLRVAAVPIEIGGVTIPKGSRIILLLAAASRDPDLFDNPDQFDPDRPNIEHYGLGGGIHYCFGAPLARLEGQIALTAIARGLENPKLLVDPPPYGRAPCCRPDPPTRLDRRDLRLTVWSVTCFVVRAGFRGQGLTYDLAQAAVEFARESGAAAVEGYPIVAKAGQKITWDEASVGTPQVFGAAGLEQVSSPTVRRRVMRADFS